MGRLNRQDFFYFLGEIKLCFVSFFLLLLSGCTAANPSVKSLLSSLDSFSLNQHQIRIQSLADLSNITVDATCDSNNTSFEYHLPSDPVDTWTTLPSTPTGIFTAIDNQCTTNRKLSFSMNLSATSPFSTMTLGSTNSIQFRDQNVLGISFVENLDILYAQVTLSDNRLLNGQGMNNTITGSASDTLQGRAVPIQQYPTITGSASDTLQGTAVFQ